MTSWRCKPLYSSVIKTNILSVDAQPNCIVPVVLFQLNYIYATRKNKLAWKDGS